MAKKANGKNKKVKHFYNEVIKLKIRSGLKVLKKCIFLTFDLSLFGSSGISNGLFSLIFTDFNSCQETHRITPSGQSISNHPLPQKSFHPLHFLLDIYTQ